MLNNNRVKSEEINYVEQALLEIQILKNLNFDNYKYIEYSNNKAFLVLLLNEVAVKAYNLRSKTIWTSYFQEPIQAKALPTRIYLQNKFNIYANVPQPEPEPEINFEPENYAEKYFELVKKLTAQNLTLTQLDEIIGSLEPVPNEYL